MRNILFIFSSFFIFSSQSYAELGVKNYMQAWTYLSSVTRVSPSSFTKDYYAGAKARLPKLGVMTEINSISVLSWTVLTSLYCEDLVNFDQKIKDENSSQRIAHGSLNMSQSMEQVTEAQLEELFARYANLFWGRKIESDEALELKKLFLDLRSEANTGSEWGPVLIGTCTSALASLQGFAH